MLKFRIISYNVGAEEVHVAIEIVHVLAAAAAVIIIIPAVVVFKTNNLYF